MLGISRFEETKVICMRFNSHNGDRTRVESTANMPTFHRWPNPSTPSKGLNQVHAGLCLRTEPAASDAWSWSGTSGRGIARFWLEPFGKTSHFNQNSLKYVDQLFNRIYSNKEILYMALYIWTETRHLKLRALLKSAL